MKLFSYRSIMLFIVSIFLNNITHGQISNGSFESWTSNSPEEWTTIDNGITISPSSFIRSGNYSAKVTVMTNSQSSTDLRQTISVTPGQSYTFSVWVYHTEGSVAARLYVDGYRNYSNENITGQWQKIEYVYTPTTSSIEIGLRFYDRNGFDGNEIVYVDDYQPSSSQLPPGNGDSCLETEITLSLTTDNYGYETSWILKDQSTGATISSGSQYQSNKSYTESFCLPDGDYSFTIYDSYGDGICCFYGYGSYSLDYNGQTIVSGGDFGGSELTYFSISTGSNNGGGSTLDGYYSSADGLSGFQLKSALHTIIKDSHTPRSYSSIWNFYSSNSRDIYYENDNSLLDIYSENPNGADPYVYTSTNSQCGNYSGEGDCYNREHSFPKSWFSSSAPMESDIHHIFLTDGYVNSKRGSYPYGEVGSASYISANGSKLGSGTSTSGYTGIVFEPIDEFKGDIARAYFYMATRYEDLIAGWENNNAYSDAILNGTSSTAFEPWAVQLLLNWHINDPVSQKEIARNEAAYQYQGNRNPFIDHPELVSNIWGNSSSRLKSNKEVLNIRSISQDQQQRNYQIQYSENNNELIVKVKKNYTGQLSIINLSGQQEYLINVDQPETRLKANLKANTIYLFHFDSEEVDHTVKFIY
ncbi:endonuclease [Mangrovivirga sp. M17]|uniref:Endonuclease n=1 Tax=Mangrovivirga halotolerans TaxID=2993936 RepID=A0ABT3RP07_9BACT|nr:endonuclease [Mangrovivirga halotolerans]MCX2743528.1 endonuclease [Mangrovivirga halotolerans]